MAKDLTAAEVAYIMQHGGSIPNTPNNLALVKAYKDQRLAAAQESSRVNQNVYNLARNNGLSNEQATSMARAAINPTYAQKNNITVPQSILQQATSTKYIPQTGTQPQAATNTGTGTSTAAGTAAGSTQGSGLLGSGFPAGSFGETVTNDLNAANQRLKAAQDAYNNLMNQGVSYNISDEARQAYNRGDMQRFFYLTDQSVLRDTNSMSSEDLVRYYDDMRNRASQMINGNGGANQAQIDAAKKELDAAQKAVNRQQNLLEVARQVGGYSTPSTATASTTAQPSANTGGWWASSISTPTQTASAGNAYSSDYSSNPLDEVFAQAQNAPYRQDVGGGQYYSPSQTGSNTVSWNRLNFAAQVEGLLRAAQQANVLAQQEQQRMATMNAHPLLSGSAK